ncbi:MAG: DUF1351 domain-containing protein [Oscillospiraceae bacterium]
MESMEFVMGTSLEALPKTIEFNFQDLKLEMGRRLEYYSGLVIAESDIKNAKDDRAKLNKLREAVENWRKDVKKEWMAPYADFEAKIKELVALIDKPILAIDSQLGEYEDKRRMEKRSEILAIYEETIGELRAILPFERLWRDDWYNVGMTLKKIRSSITDAEMKSASDLEVLSTVESEFSEAVKLKYLDTLDISEALQERARLQEQSARLRDYEDQQARAKAAEIARRADAEMRATPSAPAQDNAAQADGMWEPGGGASVEEPVPVSESKQIYRLCFECQVTMAQAGELSQWLKDHSINFRRV